MARWSHGRRSAAARRIPGHAERTDRRGVRVAPGPGRSPEGPGHRGFRFHESERPVRPGWRRAVTTTALVRARRAATPGLVDRRPAERPHARAHRRGTDARGATARRAWVARTVGLVHRLLALRALHYPRSGRLHPARRLQQR